MDNKYIENMLSKMDKDLSGHGISRRQAMKMAGLSSAGIFVGTTTGASAEEEKIVKSDAKAKIVIVGGGLAGISTAARLTLNLSNPDITIIEPEKTSASYQPGQTLVAAGIWDEEDILYERDDFVPDGVKVIEDRAVFFNPQENKLTTEKGQVVTYDYLILAMGVQLDFERIKGLEEAGRAYSSGNNDKLLDALGDSICSIYTAQGSTKTWEIMQKYIAQAKSGSSDKKTKFVFTHPSTPIKCGGAPKKIIYLTNARLKEVGARENAELTFYPNGGAMFGVPEYHDAIVGSFKSEGIKLHYRHNLI